ncbi:hypothetical protein [Candidatus Coxiella mudrowiae]|uniref:hypothetical protein n=1 Tax=Candidatus Coxiella mudrowiae TaxID=2054173 RepID=UPI0012FEF71A|nr:hypothetical protein [Candidatus Coxiella mudrowiae]
MEYDFSDYGNRRLNTLTNIIAFPTTRPYKLVYTQHGDNIQSYTPSGLVRM